jgi:3-isopropylmalate/(R)-2-methylmalate dehydratase small subunit
VAPFTNVSGIAAPFPRPNVDTDVIMPKSFLKGIDRSGLDIGVFNLLRFPDGERDPDFILNKPDYADTKFLVVGPNFGCGSSREHAVWGMMQYGIRALIGTSFAGIFDDNCSNNGLLTIVLDKVTVDHILDVVSLPEQAVMTINLVNQTIHLDAGSEVIAFDIDALRKDALLRGLDAIGVTLAHTDDICAFEADYKRANPWL